MRFVAAALFAFVVAACASRGPAPKQADAEREVRLVVLVVVDQLPSWALDRIERLPTFGRLLREGAVVRAAAIPYATPFTACGHAAIGTGAPPSASGIVGNSWYRRAEGTDRPAEYDPEAPPFVVGASQDGELSADDAASGKALRVEGLAEALRRGTGGKGQSVAISLKPRAAAFMLGARPDLAIWYEAAAGGMTTTRAYGAAAPRWLERLAEQQPATRFFDQVWRVSDAAGMARIAGIADDAVGEGSVHGLGPTFPHDLGKSERPARAFLHTPFADELVLETALAAIAELGLGADAVPDVLAVGFNAHDYAGHLWGPRSWEVHDLERHLDDQLARLFQALDTRVGAGRWAVVLTSDHGMTPIVEQRQRAEARRIPTAEVTAAADAAIAGKLGAAPDGKSWVAKIASSNVYLVPAFAEQAAEAQTAALTAAGPAIAALPGIAAAGSTAAIAGDCGRKAPLERALCLAVVPGEAGELYAVPAHGSLITDYPTGSHHDAPFDDNRLVPIIVQAPGLKHQVESGTLLQVAPTVAALLGVAPPAAATAPPLFGLAAPRRAR